MKLFKIIIPLILTATAALLLTSAKKQTPKEKAQEEAIKAALTQIPQQATPAQKRKLLVFTIISPLPKSSLLSKRINSRNMMPFAS